MLKAKRILNDLKHNLKGKQRMFNFYDVEHNALESKNLDISVLDIIRALAPYEIDFKSIYGVDFDDVIYNNRVGKYNLIDLNIDSNNSYNWGGQVVFNYNKIRVTDFYDYEHEYITIKFHRYGDVRGNYTDYMVLNMSMEQFFEVVMESSTVYCQIEIKGKVYELSTNCYNEACIFELYADNGEIYDDHVYLDIDNLRNKKDIKRALVTYLKECV